MKYKMLSVQKQEDSILVDQSIFNKSIERLDNLADETLCPEDPFSYLVLVRKNTCIPTDLKTICVNYQKEVQQIATAIQKGDWANDIFTWEAEDNPFSRSKDLAFIAYCAGKISRDQFQTAVLYHDIQLNFGKTSCERGYIYKGELIEYEPVRGAVFVDSLLDGPSFSAFGELWLDGVIELTKEGKGQTLDKTKMKAALSTLPFHPTLFSITLKKEVVKKDNLNIFFREFNNSEANRLLLVIESDDSSDVSLVIPDMGLVHAFLSEALNQLGKNQDHRVRAVSMLGTMSSRTVGQLHADGYHVVTVLDARVQSNFCFPHDKQAGEVVTQLHDIFLHLDIATEYSVKSRQFLCVDLPKALDSLPCSPLLAEVKESMIDSLIDLKITNKENNYDGFVQHATYYLMATLISSNFNSSEGGAFAFIPLYRLTSFVSKMLMPALKQMQQSQELSSDSKIIAGNCVEQLTGFHIRQDMPRSGKVMSEMLFEADENEWGDEQLSFRIFLSYSVKLIVYDLEINGRSLFELEKDIEAIADMARDSRERVFDVPKIVDLVLKKEIKVERDRDFIRDLFQIKFLN